MLTFCGSREYLAINSRIWRGMVAEKNTVCRSAGHGLEDQLDVFAETHVEHDVRLVQHHHLDRVQPQRFPAHVIHQPAGCADHDLGALPQPLELALIRLPAVDRQGADAAFEQGQLVDLLGDLHGQFAGRAQDQHLDGVLLRVGHLDRRDGKGGGLAGAGLGLADHILALH
jgi:hypothetical protein